MARIFINYRRDDTQGVAGRLFDYLAARYSRDELFMDVDAMQPGLDFAKQLDTQVSQCHVLLAVIGPHWVEAHDQTGHRRLDNERDSVRVELSSALKRDIAVIPVLVDGAVMPSEESLPDNLKALSRRHALELRHTRFVADADAIVHALEKVVPRSRIPWRLVAPAAVAAIVALAAVVLWPKFVHKPVPQPTGVTSTSPAPVASSVSSTPAVPSPSPVQGAAAPVPTTTSTQPVTAAVPVATPPATSPDGLLAGTRPGDMMRNIILHSANLPTGDQPADAAGCQAECRKNPSCASWSFTLPKPNGEPGFCGLKPMIPEAMENSCCVSGVERAPAPEFRSPPPLPANMTGAFTGIDLFGGIMSRVPILGGTAESCQAACAQSAQCAMWTYVRSGVAGPEARCSLKDKLPIVVHDNCCISGVKLMQNTDLPRQDYRNVPKTADAGKCQSLCKGDNECVAWTYVHPDAQTPTGTPLNNAGVCYLKNKIPQPQPSACCTSSIERTDTH
jgi:hypothetical protein